MIMNSVAIGLIGVACITTGAMRGLFLQKIRPEHHRDSASKDTIKLGAGMLAALTALVLGLLVSSAKSSFDATNTGIAQGGAKLEAVAKVYFGDDATPAGPARVASASSRCPEFIGKMPKPPPLQDFCNSF